MYNWRVIKSIRPYQYLDEMLTGPLRKWRHLHRFNDIYRELFKSNESTDAIYKEYIDYFQKLNQQWIQYFWSPFLTQAQVKETKKIREKMEG
jgi:ligand-binding SRPBCC domain-containing protein